MKMSPTTLGIFGFYAFEFIKKFGGYLVMFVVIVGILEECKMLGFHTSRNECLGLSLLSTLKL